MTRTEEVRLFLEISVFKGKILRTKKGRGGIIYIVERDSHPKLVAYKTIQEFETNFSLNDPVDTERIDREVKNWVSFSGHPLIIRPHFIEIRKGFPLICMPYCKGDLTDFLQEGLSLTGVVCLSMQVVKGMMAAKVRGMDHHQDVKLENLLYVDWSKKFRGFPPSDVDPSLSYSVRIADFGVANAWHDGHLGGTNIYKAPEQYDASAYDTFDPDVFGVGIVIAELYQGFHPATDDPNIRVSNWRGSRLKKWAINGKRNIASSNDPQATELRLLIEQMLNADPVDRPSFHVIFDKLARILGVLSPKSLEQLELLFEYFDYISTHCELESEIHRQLGLARIPSQRKSVKSNFEERLKALMVSKEESSEIILSLHRLAIAYNEICFSDKALSERELLIDASTRIVKYILERHDSITADYLYPPFLFRESNSKSIGSDLNAKAELLTTSISRLQSLDAYSEKLAKQVEEGGDVIRACRVFNDASEMWKHANLPEACRLMRIVTQLVPEDRELVSLYDEWVEIRDSFNDLLS